MSAKDSGPIVFGGVPRIDFLPLEVKQRKANRRSRRSLIGLVIVVLAACLAGYAFSAYLAIQGQMSLVAEQAKTQELLEAQTEFIEAKNAADALAAATNARLVASSPEILWKAYFAELAKTMPGKATILSFAVDAQNVLELDFGGASTVPLENPRIATIEFTVRTATLPIADKVMINLRGMTGYADAAASTIQADDDGGYIMSITLNVNSEAFERRFFLMNLDGTPKDGAVVVEEEEETAEEDAAGTPTNTPTPNPTSTSTEDED
ncbi:hypothetical protein EYE40_10825 [Glaciihabitans arcticus]|uniref:Fimbrial assembly protein n=1 Tax=Glaciihabitans arcticus TaxID=2668039 RepID=A0A4Q9GYI1_9MICO|nr:hypothetical protein [Glaciihabitans arcticus]TBN57843.1 hypothetical protein EYE40_10825 [Glaciihabitans arcticus]